MLFPVWSTGSTNPQNKEGDATFDSKEHDAEKPESRVNLSLSRNRDFNAVFDDFSEDSSNDVSAASPIVPTAGQNYSNSTNPISAAGPIVHTAGQNYSNSTNLISAAGPIVPAAGHNYSNSTNPISVAGPSNSNSSLTHGQSLLRDTYLPRDMVDIEDIVYPDHENVGAEADFNNLETSIIVSPIPTTRTHNAHPTFIIACLHALSQEEPKRIHQALKDPSWIEAMHEELLHFKMKKVWILVDLPHGKRAIGTKWVYRNKNDERGIVLRNKANLSLKDTHKKKESTMKKGGRICCQPLGFEDLDHPDKVYKLVKALYCLHQAPRA
nr:hypothetical protein [Tanacetum cinerariifolium]